MKCKFNCPIYFLAAILTFIGFVTFYFCGCDYIFRGKILAFDKILFVTDRDGNREIYVMDMDGSNQVNLTNNSADDEWPVLSPDRTKIAFVSNSHVKSQ